MSANLWQMSPKPKPNFALVNNDGIVLALYESAHEARDALSTCDRAAPALTAGVVLKHARKEDNGCIQLLEVVKSQAGDAHKASKPPV